MYLAFLLLQVGFGLLAANWFIGLTGIGLIVSVIADRVAPEEARLSAAFGAAYQEYAGRTGRFLPRLGS
jgi:protein-S-isoprenylcysteine O-methyltransferase Ste14